MANEVTFKPTEVGLIREIRAEVRKGEPSDIYFYHRDSDRFLAMNNVTATLRRSSGGQVPVPVEALVVVQDPDTMLCKVNVAVANSATLEENCYVIWEWDGADRHYSRRQEYDVVLFRLYPVVTDGDLRAFVPDLDSYLPQRRGQKLQSSWQPQIDKAFTEIQRRLRNNGNRPCLVLDSEQLRQVHEPLSLAMIASAILSTNGADMWAKLAERWTEQYENEWARLKLDYDLSNEGQVAQNERNQKARKQVILVRA